MQNIVSFTGFFGKRDLYFLTSPHHTTLQHTETHCNKLQHTATDIYSLFMQHYCWHTEKIAAVDEDADTYFGRQVSSVCRCIVVCCSVLQCVAVCCSACIVLKCIAVAIVCCIAVCCSVLQCGVVCWNALCCLEVYSHCTILFCLLFYIVFTTQYNCSVLFIVLYCLYNTI